MKIFRLITVSLLLLSGNVYALEFGVGVKAGTTGIGTDLSFSLTKTINARISLTKFDVDDVNETLTVGDAGAEGDIDATLGIDFGSNALLLDWYVFDGTFHVTGGFMKNNGKATLSGKVLSTITVNGDSYDAGDLEGNLINGEVALGDSYEPYLGVGWGRKAGNEPGLAISFEIGVALLEPTAQLSTTINTTNGLSQAELDSRIQATVDDVNDELDDFALYPVISLGINYAF